jgi:replicative superfamily II helicase
VEAFNDIAKEKFHQLSKLFGQSPYRVAKTFDDLNKDIQVLQSYEIIVTTPSAWESVSRRWKARKGF